MLGGGRWRAPDSGEAEAAFDEEQEEERLQEELAIAQKKYARLNRNNNMKIVDKSEHEKNKVSYKDSESIKNIFVKFFPKKGNEETDKQFKHFIDCIEKSDIMIKGSIIANREDIHFTREILNKNECYKKNKALIMNFNLLSNVNEGVPYLGYDDIYKLAKKFLYNSIDNIDIKSGIDELIVKNFDNVEYKISDNYESKYIYFLVALELINILFYLNGRSCKLWTSGNFIKKLHKIADCMKDNKPDPIVSVSAYPIVSVSANPPIFMDDYNSKQAHESVSPSPEIANNNDVESMKNLRYIDDGDDDDDDSESTGGKKTRRKTKGRKTKGRKTKRRRRTKKKTYKLKGRRKYRK